jgi:transposase
MRCFRLWLVLLGVQEGVVERVEYAGGAVVVHARLRRGQRLRCGVCGEPSPGHDQGAGRRRWRALDLGIVQAFIEAAAPRVECQAHGVVVAQMPWSRHQSRFTRAFEEQVCWLVTRMSKSAVSQLMRVDWQTVGRMVERVVEELGSPLDELESLRRIGIDEISFRRGHRYLTVVVNHDSGRLLWAAEGHDQATLHRFFDLIGPEKCRQIELVTADAAHWIRRILRERCPQARVCMDAFHVIAWATDALDVVRREVWNEARRTGQHALAKNLKWARFALWKNPQHLSQRQQARLADIERTNRKLYRAYLLKEQLRQVFALKGAQGVELLRAWLAWATRSRLPAFVELARTIRRNFSFIQAALEERFSNALIEGVNTRIRLATRVAFGFRSAQALIATVMLTCGGLCPPLPGRA